MPIMIQDLRLGQKVKLIGVIRELDMTDGDELLPDGELHVTLHVTLDEQPGTTDAIALPGSNDPVELMGPAYAARVTRNSPAVGRRLTEAVGAEAAAKLLAEFHISPKDS